MVVLARIDQRLIHGLVVNQWAPALQVKRFMVVDDVLCNNDDIKASMRMAKPAGTGVSVISTETAITNFKAGKYDGQRVLILVKEPETLIKLMEGGVEIPKVDLGIMFNEDGREAGLGIAMGNAADDVKSIADEITLDNEHEGVAAAIGKFCYCNN